MLKFLGRLKPLRVRPDAVVTLISRDMHISGKHSCDCESYSTINGFEKLKKASGCALLVTGGTETKQLLGKVGQDSFYKHWQPTRWGCTVYPSTAGNIYDLERNHWDFTH